MGIRHLLSAYFCYVATPENRTARNVVFHIDICGLVQLITLFKLDIINLTQIKGALEAGNYGTVRS